MRARRPAPGGGAVTWLFVPSISSNCAPASAGSASASGSPCPERVASLTWRGKRMPPRHWLRAWQKLPWLRRLSGLTLPASTLDASAASWIASLAVIRASRTATPAPCGTSTAERTTSASSSGTCSASSTSAGLLVSSAKTCRGTPPASLKLSSRHWNGWATALQREFSARPKSALRTSASGSSSWPTPAASDHKGAPSLKTINRRAAQSSRGVRLPEHLAKVTQTEVLGNLNPEWVEWLMGWPIGWTGSASVATELSHWRRRMHGALSTLSSPPIAPQADLFS